MTLEWTFVNLLIQALAGFLGAQGAAIAAHEHRFGFAGHSLVGLAAGALSGWFLQLPAMTAVMGNGTTMPITSSEAVVLQALTGAVVGGIAMLVVSFIRSEMSKR
jgi:hypothetical protein